MGAPVRRPPVQAASGRFAPALLACLLFTSALAGPDEAGHWASRFETIREAARGIRSVQAEFVQTKRLRILREPLRSKGRLVFRGPDRLRWEYTEPLRSVLLLRGERVARYTLRRDRFVPDEAIRLEALRAVVAELRLWLAGRFRSSRHFRPEIEPGPHGPRLVLHPIDEELAALIQRIVIEPDTRAGVLRSVEIEEGPGAVTRIEILRVRLNEEVDEALFERPEP
ncbi:MAG: outer membrane lipoprotein carrier protein LolA [Deltaproteobacteria bacterium]|nr:outer membrane lipoprotein carrier protein LolA [Deltaproteobacteria bacterium]